ncbi:leucine-rich repeat-containing protein 34-like [Cotesia glomerata]|uniref:leucine-rich repeat-containing protein 34-like n=1 Tax=Cotesia glomerata TaxID=32391 RepID=UPI001D01A89D|nr:leucine-rich repeat-containing protein 34-like [Cotesia glomerata]
MIINSSIDHLDVAEIDITTSSFFYFMSALKSSSLKIIDLSRPIPQINNYLDSEYFARIIGSMLKINTNLTELHLQKYNFSCHDIESMLIDAKFNKTLQLIDLGCNNIGDHGLESICNWICENPALSGLILSHNIITDTGARALSFVLPFSKIILLDVSYNKIKDNGIKDILNIINNSTSIRYLRIYGNTISSSAEIIERILESGVLEQDNLDVKPYKVDGKFYAAHYPADHYKQRYYNVPQSNLYSQNPTIFAYVDAAAIKPKQRRISHRVNRRLIGTKLKTVECKKSC